MPTKRKRKTKYSAVAWVCLALVVLVGVGLITYKNLVNKPEVFVVAGDENGRLPRLEIKNGDIVESTTGRTVMLRGNNYFRVEPVPNTTSYTISDFRDVTYNNPEIRAQRVKELGQMQRDGYNAIRIFVDHAYIMKHEGGGEYVLDGSYLDNLADFIRQADQSGMYLLVTFRRMPVRGSYRVKVVDPNFFGPNNQATEVVAPFTAEYLSPGLVEGKAKYLSDVISNLKERQAPLNAVFGWSIDNEPYLTTSANPLALDKEGTITFVDPTKSYNLKGLKNNTVEQRRILDESMRYTANKLSNAIKSAVGPQALVGISLGNPTFTAANTPTRKDTILPTLETFASSQLDYIDVHIYPGYFPLETEMKAYQYAKNNKVLILGEFGVRPKIGATSYSLPMAAEALKKLQVETCTNYNFKGWFAYDYTNPYKDDSYDKTFKYWHAMEGEGEINKALAPIYRPDACSTSSGGVVTSGKIDIPEKVQCGVNVTSSTCLPRTGKYSYTLSLADNPEYKRAIFATWNGVNGLDDMVKYEGEKRGDSWQVSIDQAKHAGAGGEMVSNIWTFDAAGRQVWCSKVVIPRCQN